MSQSRLPAVQRRRQLFDVSLEVFAGRGFHGASMAERAEAAGADAVAALIEADIDDDHRRLLAYGVVGLAEATSRQWVITGRREPVDTLSRRVADLTWGGLRGIRPEA